MTAEKKRIIEIDPRVIEVPREKPKHVPGDDGFFSSTELMERWHCSLDKVNKIVEPYRGQAGFIDFGSAGSLKKHTRKRGFVRIHRTLVMRIENDFT